MLFQSGYIFLFNPCAAFFTLDGGALSPTPQKTKSCQIPAVSHFLSVSIQVYLSCFFWWWFTRDIIQVNPFLVSFLAALKSWKKVMRIKRKTLSVLLHETFVTVPATSSSHLRHSFNLISNLTTLGFRLAIGENTWWNSLYRVKRTPTNI